MDPEQKLSFQNRGYLRLRRALGKQQVAPVKAHVLQELRRLNIWSSGKVLSPAIKAMPAFQQVTRVSGSIRQDGLHDRLIGKEMRSAISSLAPGNLSPAPGQFLISLPNQGPWSLNGLNWHTDIAASANDRVPGIQAFVLIDDVEPRGGATLAIAGSHLLAGQKEPSSRLREILRKEGDVEGTLGKQGLSIVEMSGETGDVYLMDMRLLHTPAINSTRNIRLMATVRYLPLDRWRAFRLIQADAASWAPARLPARGSGAKRLLLGVHAGNEAALGFYRKQGFRTSPSDSFASAGRHATIACWPSGSAPSHSAGCGLTIRYSPARASDDGKQRIPRDLPRKMGRVREPGRCPGRDRPVLRLV